MKPENRPPIDVSKLYDSERCALTNIVVTGKKETAGTLHFKGAPSLLGTGSAVRSIEDGVVVRAGRCYDPRSREYKRGVVVSIRGRNGVMVSYERLSGVAVKAGDHVCAGETIGYEGNTGVGKDVYLALRFSRNGRLVDGCQHLGIPREPCVFKNERPDAEETVCKICNFNSKERYELRTLPCADTIWDKVLTAIETCRAVQ